MRSVSMHWPAPPSSRVSESLTPDQAVLGFVAALRTSGHPVPLSSALLFAKAVAVVGIDNPGGVYWAGRSTLVQRREDRARYDTTFAAWWGSLGSLDSADADRGMPSPIDVTATRDPVFADPAGDVQADGDRAAQRSELDESAATESMVASWSRAETLRSRDFATYSAEEHIEAAHLIAAFRLAGSLRSSSRSQPVHRGRGTIDFRRTVAASMRAGGELVRPRVRARGQKRRRVVLLCDISGSMEPYTRALLRFAHAGAVSRARIEVFLMGTRLTRVTRDLVNHDPDAAMAAIAARAVDWGGGTRLGDALSEFTSTWGSQGMARGAVVVILSDGWDRGDPTILSEAMARLRRVAFRIIWVNPLQATAGFAPTACGMAAALPYLDELVEGHSIASLGDLAAIVRR